MQKDTLALIISIVGITVLFVIMVIGFYFQFFR